MDNSVVKFRRLAMYKKSKKYSNKLKCNRCGSVIQYRSEVSIVQCRCRYVVVDDSRIIGNQSDYSIIGNQSKTISFIFYLFFYSQFPPTVEG